MVELRNRPVPFDALVGSGGQSAPRGAVTHPVLAATLSAERGLAKAKRAGARAVAGLVAEHLGAVEYADDPATGCDGPTGRAEPELLYATTRELEAVAALEWRGAQPGPPLVCAPTPVIQFGEGQPLTLARIPKHLAGHRPAVPAQRPCPWVRIHSVTLPHNWACDRGVFTYHR